MLVKITCRFTKIISEINKFSSLISKFLSLIIFAFCNYVIFKCVLKGSKCGKNALILHLKTTL